jgi:hypothetical protein
MIRKKIRFLLALLFISTSSYALETANSAIGLDIGIGSLGNLGTTGLSGAAGFNGTVNFNEHFSLSAFVNVAADLGHDSSRQFHVAYILELDARARYFPWGGWTPFLGADAGWAQARDGITGQLGDGLLTAGTLGLAHRQNNKSDLLIGARAATLLGAKFPKAPLILMVTVGLET